MPDIIAQSDMTALNETYIDKLNTRHVNNT